MGFFNILLLSFCCCISLFSNTLFVELLVFIIDILLLILLEVFYSHLCWFVVLISVNHYWLIVFEIVVVALLVLFLIFAMYLCFKLVDCYHFFVFDICFSRCDVISILF
jgi:hypothetical protein